MYFSFNERMASLATTAIFFVISSTMPVSIRFYIFSEVTNWFIAAIMDSGYTYNAAFSIIRLGVNDMNAINILTPFFFADNGVWIICL